MHGWGDLQPELNTLSKQGRWEEMGRLIDDDILHTIAACGSPGRGRSPYPRPSGRSFRPDLPLPAGPDRRGGIGRDHRRTQQLTPIVVPSRTKGGRGGPEQAEYSDVLIIGAGISGIGAAYRIHEKNPQLTYTVLERRARIGGTWDLFRYPGVRSDSDIFTLSFPFEPWKREESIADGLDIWQYLDETARKHSIDEQIQLNTYVRSADWDSETDTWTVRAEQDGTDKKYRCRFLFFGTGYYNYDNPHSPELRGIENFDRDVVTPSTGRSHSTTAESGSSSSAAARPRSA